MMIAQIERRRLSDGVVEQLSHLITGGSVGVGDKLPSERELAKSLGVSRPLIREGFRALESMGLVEVRRGIGPIVTRTSIQDSDTRPHPTDGPVNAPARGNLGAVVSQLERATILDILEAREILEGKIVELASQRITPEEVKWLRATAEQADSWDDNRQFHIALASVTHNFMLERLIAMQFNLLTDAHQRDHYPSQANARRLLEQHREIAEAVITRDVGRAQTLMKEHFQQTRQTIVWNTTKR